MNQDERGCLQARREGRRATGVTAPSPPPPPLRAVEVSPLWKEFFIIIKNKNNTEIEMPVLQILTYNLVIWAEVPPFVDFRDIFWTRL